MSVKKFDLNIEKILEDWEVFHAIREIIANAIDEQILTKTRGIEIFKDDEGRWHIRDFGRGLKLSILLKRKMMRSLEIRMLLGSLV